MNYRAAPPLRADGQLPPHGFQPLFHAGQAEPGPSHCLVRVKAGARILDGQVDGVAVTDQRDVGVSWHAVLDDILQCFLQDAIDTQRDLRWQHFRDVLEAHVNRDIVPIAQLVAEPRRRRFQPQEFQFRRVQAVRERLHIGREIGNFLTDGPDLLFEIGP